MEEVIHKANHIKHRQCKIYHCTCIALHKHHPSKQLNILLKKMTKVCIKLKKKNQNWEVYNMQHKKNLTIKPLQSIRRFLQPNFPYCPSFCFNIILLYLIWLLLSNIHCSFIIVYSGFADIMACWCFL